MWDTEFITWAFTIFGAVLVVTYSNLLDFFRNWYAKAGGYPLVAGKYVITQPDPPKKVNKVAELLYKLTSCWLCTAWWAGVILALLHYGPIENPLYAGGAAVGVQGLMELLRDVVRGRRQ